MKLGVSFGVGRTFGVRSLGDCNIGVKCISIFGLGYNSWDIYIYIYIYVLATRYKLRTSGPRAWVRGGCSWLATQAML